MKSIRPRERACTRIPRRLNNTKKAHGLKLSSAPRITVSAISGSVERSVLPNRGSARTAPGAAVSDGGAGVVPPETAAVPAFTAAGAAAPPPCATPAAAAGGGLSRPAARDIHAAAGQTLAHPLLDQPAGGLVALVPDDRRERSDERHRHAARLHPERLGHQHEKFGIGGVELNLEGTDLKLGNPLPQTGEKLLLVDAVDARPCCKTGTAEPARLQGTAAPGTNTAATEETISRS